MKNAIRILTVAALAAATCLRPPAVSAQDYTEAGFRAVPSEREDFNLVGAGLSYRDTGHSHGDPSLTAVLASRWAYLSGDWTKGLHFDALHAGPRLGAFRLDIVRNGRDIRLYAPFYPVAGIARVRDAGGVFDYGAAFGVAAGHKDSPRGAGLGVTARWTRHTRAITVHFAF